MYWKAKTFFLCSLLALERASFTKALSWLKKSKAVMLINRHVWLSCRFEHHRRANQLERFRNECNRLHLPIAFDQMSRKQFLPPAAWCLVKSRAGSSYIIFLSGNRTLARLKRWGCGSPRKGLYRHCPMLSA